MKIGTLVVPINVPPNTELPLIGLGKVIINEQIIPTSGGRTRSTACASSSPRNNLLGLPVGSEIIIAHAEAAAARF